MLKIGSLVDNKYKILSEVGRGGMSVVYLAINERANKTWAVKEIRKDGVCNFEAVKQGLVVETDMLKKLNHDHLPSIIDVIDLEDSFIIVMDYIEGKSLQHVINNGGAQPQELVIQWGIQLCDVLGYLHSRTPAIIYRDMKPANVMLKPNGDVMLIDFGTAREFKNRAMVEDTTCLGTRGYAAPEQFGGRGQTDARTDIYCLGATLYHLITGHSPAEPPYEIKPLSYWNSSYAGSGLEYIISKCCQQDPDARYQNCAELMYDLEHVEEVDYQTIRSRKMKWTAFLTSVLVFLLSVAGMLGAMAGKKSATMETYGYYLNQAQNASGQEFVDMIKQAVDIDPGRVDAYEMLLDWVESDGKLDLRTEWSPINQLLMNTSSGQRVSNDQMLLNNDIAGYARVNFRVGRLLSLLASNEDEYIRKATVYFERALGEGHMADSDEPNTMQQAKVAQSLSMIGKYTGSLGKNNNLYLDQEYTYGTLWQELQTLQEQNTAESMGNIAMCITLNGRIAGLMIDNYAGFAGEGISRQNMLDFLDKLDASVLEQKALVSQGNHAGAYSDILAEAATNISTARVMVSGMKGA